MRRERPAALTAEAPSPGPRRQINLRRLFRSALPALSLIIVLLAIRDFNPRAISYFGFNLMLNLAVPVRTRDRRPALHHHRQ